MISPQNCKDTICRKSARMIRRSAKRREVAKRAKAIRSGRSEMTVLVYQMGKVGSSTISFSMRTAGIECEHVHRVLPETIKAVRKQHLQRGVEPKDERVGLAIGRRLRESNEPVRIITMGREPISRNISAYFQNLSEFFVGEELNSIRVDGAIETFLEEYPHQTPVKWFDDEFETATGLSVYRGGFDFEKGYEIFTEGKYSVLCLRVEEPDETKQIALEEFLGRKDIILTSANVANQKAYADLYREFKNQVVLPEEYIDNLLQSKYATYFYSGKELERIREGWSKNRR